MGEFDPKLRFAQSPVARLATSTPDGTPHLVPVVFALGARRPAEATGADVIYTAVDAKRKTTQRLRRLANLEHNPRASVLVDSYADDWTQLWWVRADGVAAIHRDGEVMRAAYRSAARQICSIPIGSVERPGNRNSSPALGQLARLTTTTAPIAYYSPDPTLVLGGSWEKSCLLRPAGPHHGNRPRRTGGKPWPTE